MNKKIKVTVYFIFMLVSFLGVQFLPSDSVVMEAYANTSENIWDDAWQISSDGLYSYYISKDGTSAKIFYYEGPWNIKKLTIPDSIDGYKVTAIGNRISEIQWKGPFHYIEETIEEMVIPDTVIEIGSDSFIYLSKLKKITLPKHIKEFPDRVFYGCSSLKDIILPKQLNKIGDSAFSNTAITKINLSDSITYIGPRAFSDCTELRTVTLPSNLESISALTFSNTAIKSIKIPDSVTRIDNLAFRSCKQLIHVDFSKNLSYVGYRAFDGTAWLAGRPKEEFFMINGTILISYNGNKQSPVIPKGTIGIMDNAFANKSMTEIVIPDSVEYIGDYAFSNCVNLQKVVLPKNLKKVNSNVFYHTALESIELPNSVTFIGQEAFYKCEKLKEIKFGSNIKQIDSNAFLDTPWLNSKALDEYVMIHNILLLYNGTDKEPTIPMGTINIAGGAFKNKRMSRILIPETVEYIGTGAFFNTNLDSVLFMGDAPEIGNSVFVKIFNEFTTSIYTKVYYNQGKTGYDTGIWNIYNPSVYGDTSTDSIDNTEDSSGASNENSQYGVKIDKKQFPDDYFRDFVTRYDTNKDGYLSNKETDEVTSIYYNNKATESDSTLMKNTKSLKGIEYFTKLMTINISNSKIIYLDLSKNVKIEKVEAMNCNFKSFNISQCRKLKELYVSDTKFSKLDLNNNTQLRLLDCAGGQFNILDLNNNKLLNTLKISGARWNKINITKNTKLEVLKCENCELKNLQLKYYKKLKELDISYNYFKTIDISKNLELVELVCNNNQLTKIIVENNSKLKTLRCDKKVKVIGWTKQ